MDWLTVVYFLYTFIAFYFLFIYLLIYVQNKKQIYESLKPDKVRSLTMVVPCFNVSNSVSKTVEALINQDYPGLKKIVLVDDCSTDNTFDVLKSFAKKYKIVQAVQTPKNTGRAAGSKNFGAKFAKTELIGFSDDDSVPKKDAISKMVGFFNDPKMGAVTSRVLVENRINLLSRIQSIEYKVMAFTRKLLGFIDSIYVTNGPLSLYRMKGFLEVGGFDMHNWTEDIELTWAFVAHDWKIQMCIPATVYTSVPETIKVWFKQRVRWNVGGIQTVAKYRKKWVKTGMLGIFIMPFFLLSWFIGLTGLFLMGYRIFNYLISRYLITKYSVVASVAIVRVQDISLNPSILFYFGMILFFLGLTYLFLALVHSREKSYKGHSLLDIFIYSIFYLLMAPPLLIYSFYKFIVGLDSW